MYTFTKEVHHATGVELAVAARFTTSKVEELVTAQSNNLVIYHIDDTKMLREVHREALEERVVSLDVVADPQSSYDLLLVGFAEAKMSILRFCRAERAIITVSMHFYGKEFLELGTITELNQLTLKIRADPEGRCAVMQPVRDVFAIMPFREREGAVDIDKAPFLPSFVVRSHEIDPRIMNVIDIALLPSYHEPTMAILFEPRRTFTSRLSALKDTVHLAIVSIDLMRRSFAPLFYVDQLPHDCFSLTPVPRPVGGVLVTSPSCLMHFDQASMGGGLAVNAYARLVTNFALFDMSELTIHLDSSQIVFIASDLALIALADGTLMHFSIRKEGRNMSGFNIVPIGREVAIPSCLIRLSDDMVFIGSCNSESLLLAVSASASTKPLEPKRRAAAQDDELDFLLGVAEEPTKAAREENETAMEIDGPYRIRDRLPCVSLVRDFAVGMSELHVDSSIYNAPFPNETMVDVVIAAGHSRQSSLHILRETVRPRVSSTFDLVDETLDMWALKCGDSPISEHKFLLITKKSKSQRGFYTMALDVGDNLNELDSSDFYLDGPTLFAASMSNGACLAQVYGKAIRLINASGKLIAEFPFSVFGEFEAVLCCRIAGDMIVCLTADLRVLVFEVSEGQKVALVHSDLQVDGGIDCVDVFRVEKKFSSADYYLALIPSSGVLHVFELPSMKLVFCSIDLRSHAPVLKDVRDNSRNGEDISEYEGSFIDVKFVELGTKNRRQLFLLAFTKSSEVLIYKAFTYNGCLRFKRHTFLVAAIAKTKTADQDLAMDLNDDSSLEWRRRYFIPFDDIQGIDTKQENLPGVFVVGEKPYWILQNDRAVLRHHPMSLDGKITAFTSFNNVNCQHGFIFFNSQSQLRLCQIDDSFDLRSPNPTRSVRLNNNPDDEEAPTSPFKIVYHSASVKYAFISYKETPFLYPLEEVLPPVTREVSEEDQKVENQPYQPHSGQYMPTQGTFFLSLIAPRTWASVDQYAFEDKEQVLCMVNCALDVKISGMKKSQDYIVITTGFVKGEDHNIRGKVYIFEIIDVVPEVGRPETNHKLKLIHHEDTKGAVGSICSLEGYLCMAIGPKVMMYSFESGDSLVGIAFLDTNLFVTTMTTLKSFMYLGDIQKGTCFNAYQDEPSKLATLGKNFYQSGISAVEFLVDGPHLALLSADFDNNIQVLTYSPFTIASMNGQKLLRRGDFHFQAGVVRFVRAMKRSAPTEQGCIYVTQDGRLGVIFPTDEKVYKRLTDIANEMVSRMEHVAGLNPRAAVLFRSRQKQNGIPVRNVLSVNFVTRYLAESHSVRSQWARNKGTSAPKAIEDLVAILSESDIF